MSRLLKRTILCLRCNRSNFKRWSSSSSKPSYFHYIGTDPFQATTLGILLENSAKKFGEREAVISRYQKRNLTFEEALTEADALAAGLLSLGLQKGDRLGLWAPNLIEWHVTKMACARIGLILVALNPAYQAPEIEYCINKVNIKAIICAHKFKEQNYYELLNAVAPELSKSEPGKLSSDKVPGLKSAIIIGDESLRGVFNYKEVLSFASETILKSVKNNQHLIQPDDGCSIQFTSGTTGKPKAALLSHFGLVNNSYEIGKRNELNRKHHKICVQVPFFHVFGIDITIMAALHFGATLVLPGPGYNPHLSLDAIKEENCSAIHGTPTMYVDLVNVQESRKESISPEIAVVGGAPCSPHLFQRILQALKVKKVKSVFGLTETCAVVFQSRPDDNEFQVTSTVGHLGDHLEAKVVDENNRIVPFGSPGELCIRGYCNMLGYWGDEEKTKEMIGRDGWLKTGDQFILQEDGYGRIVGRLKEMIIRGGENIFPKEIEDFLNTHPDILETHVIGVPHERLGEEVCACIRVKGDANVTQEEIARFSKGKIAHFKIPSRVKIVKKFPKTTSGKIQKFKLVEQFK